MPPIGEWPRHVTWPGGVALILLVLALISTALRRRSTLWQALFEQFWIGFAVMALATAGIWAVLPQKIWQQGGHLPGH